MAEEHDTVRGLVLAGGGAKGSYQVGVYQALMELGWLPDVITGASVGAPERSTVCDGQGERSGRPVAQPG